MSLSFPLLWNPRLNQLAFKDFVIVEARAFLGAQLADLVIADIAVHKDEKSIQDTANCKLGVEMERVRRQRRQQVSINARCRRNPSWTLSSDALRRLYNGIVVTGEGFKCFYSLELHACCFTLFSFLLFGSNSSALGE
uniref:Uncharacterized protein n=1 Tax=Ascaris lumbricoides TaxID=6252 RepID=A0A0M3ILI0_ASCLU